MSARERPILFSGPMVCAILSGQKTQTRRVMVPQPAEWIDTFGFTTFTPPGNVSGRGYWKGVPGDEGPGEKFFPCKYGVVGDRLWVRETFWDHGDYSFAKATTEQRIEYRATPWDRKGDPEDAGGWKPSIHMPRWASRLSLEITRVRVERLQIIDEDDAIAEGLHVESTREGMRYHYDVDAPVRHWWIDPVDAYRTLWNNINAKRGYGWDLNPWVWVLEFKRAEAAKAVA